jgi:hypothetical protein
VTGKQAERLPYNFAEARKPEACATLSGHARRG